jgi:putative ABC transport system permease protein
MLIADLRRTWRQGIAISLLLACGIALFVMTTSAMRSLETSMQRYYRNYQFADLFVRLTRAPLERADRIARLPGVLRVQTRVIHAVLLDMPGMVEPASCRLVSISQDADRDMNRVHLRRGRFPLAFGHNEVIASEPFAEAHRLNPGDSLTVNMDGRMERLRIVGIGLSPECVYAVQPGLLLTDNRRFGILWMPRRQMEAAFNMEGAFNDLSLTLQPRANVADVVFEVDRILESFGGQGAYGRADQESHRRLADEMHQMRSMAFVTPMVFLSVAAFLFNIVLSRLVHQQKDQIATLRAFGYTRWELAMYYMQFMSVLVALGAALGLAVGWRMSWWMIDLYVIFFRFPTVTYQLAVPESAFAVLLGIFAASLGGFTVVRSVMQLQPAVAMRPETPHSFGATWLDRVGLGVWVSPMMRMIIRRLEANPMATCLSVLGIAMGVAVLVLGSFMRDTIDFVFDVQFGRSQRHDVMLTFNESLSPAVMHDVVHLPGVSRAEGFRSVPVRLRHGSRHHRLALMGLDEQPYLNRILDDQQHPIRLTPQSGVTLTEKLAQILEIRQGEQLEIEVLDRKMKPVMAPVAVIYSNYTDPAAYIHRQDLHRLLRESEQLSGAFLSVDSRAIDQLYTTIKRVPKVAGVLDSQAARKHFRDLINENTKVMRLVNSIFGSLIALGVIYNAALITLAESSRDLATLRVIGFSRHEVFSVVFGELAVLTLLAIPVGLVIGVGLSYLATLALDTETHRFPCVVHRNTLAYATSVICIAAVASTYEVKRMLDRLDLVQVLKVKVS